MDHDAYQQAKALFHAAIDLPHSERKVFLNERCSESLELRQAVERLLDSYDSGFLEEPAVSNAAHLSPLDSLTSGQRVKQYEIIEQIGKGGMGEVFLAQDTLLERQVALKFVPASLIGDKERLTRFRQEVRATSALNHPNIVTIHDVGTAGDLQYIATEFISGVNLRKKLINGKLAPNEALDIGIQVATALHVVHQAGIVHRDIKPENIMVRNDGLVKVLDFGLAKLIRRDLINRPDATSFATTSPGLIMGTTAYMSPEQARGIAVDERTDVWSLGVVLYEMLVGYPPFQGETQSDVLAAILTTDPAISITDLPEACRLIRKSLQKKVGRRFGTIAEVLSELKALDQALHDPTGNERTSTTVAQELVSVPAGDFGASPLEGGDLPTPITTLIGREDEIGELRRLLLRDDVRLVTLTGPGGTGKTRLATAVARELVPEFADVFFTELAPVTDPELVPSAIVHQLGVKESGQKTILEVLIAFLREREALLVIDNFEQVIEAAPRIGELLAASPKLKVLVTSRECLHLRGEREFAAPPLPFPNDSAALPLNEMLNYDAIKLFIERARNARPSFSLSDEDIRSVAAICARLDGLPLAIELAAARVKILSPHSILTRLENSLQVLTGGAQDLPARQQTMRNAIAWSYELLSEDEKNLFRRMAVFTGGFTVEAVEYVAAELEVARQSKGIKYGSPSSPPSQANVLDGLTSLIDKSLFVSNETPTGDIRFRMLEVMREFAFECLEANAEVEGVRRRHSEYYLTLGEKAEPNLQTSDGGEWLSALEMDHDNLRSAIRWLFENDVEKAARLVSGIRLYLLNHSHLTEGREWLEMALAKNSALPAPLHFNLLHFLGVFALTRGDYEAARRAYEENLSEGRISGDKERIAESLRGLAATLGTQNEWVAAQTFFEESLAIHRELGNAFGIAGSLIGLGAIVLKLGNLKRARTLTEEALMIFRELGYTSGMCTCLINLGEYAYRAKSYELARRFFVEAFAIAKRLGYRHRIGSCLDGFAALGVRQHEWKKAAQLAGAAEKLRESVGFVQEPLDREFRRMYIKKCRSTLGEESFSAAVEQGREMKTEDAIALALDTNRLGHES